MSADVFQGFWNMCLEILELEYAFFVTAIELAWPATFKTAKVGLDLLNDTGLLLMVGKGIRGGICHVIYEYGETNKKYMKDYNKNKE